MGAWIEGKERFLNFRETQYNHLRQNELKKEKCLSRSTVVSDFAEARTTTLISMAF